ncbi:uncharacterized protein T069G_11193 [Trichoderma breve]|uniref:DUF7136 domain-containing protein n=1 Tax=Trichoderma breve TaxID=2034170 RepID=A0A9W9B4M6_9HYPO|nr:uncharacterized protein T069G_11193 [Trichoderma breve]KAJ4854214.1 hypothetical protein T069G_11193 [Trichoderma breve]
MGASSHVRFAFAALLASLMTAMGAKSTYPTLPATLEVDLLFPRNETYAPSWLMPVVFAVQNSSLAVPLDVQIQWTMWEGNNTRSPGSIGLGGYDVAGDVAGARSTPKNPYLISDAVNTISYPDGVWTLAWYVQYNSCEYNDPEGPWTTYSENFTTVFTVSKSGKAIDLEAATSSDVCGAAQAQAFNITSPGKCDSSFGPSPTTNPCAATIDSAAASSISAWVRAVGSICTSYAANLTCQDPSPPPGQPSAANPRVTAASTLLTLLVALDVLIHLA